MASTNTKKRQNILHTTIALFRQTHDIKKVSIEAIAVEAHVSPTTIYNNFGTRDELLCEVTKSLIRENLDRNIKLIHSDLPFPQKLTGIISGKMDVMDQYNREIIDKIISQDKNIAPFIDKIYEEEIKPLWLEMLSDGKKQGFIDPSLKDEVLLTYLDVLKTGFSVKPELTKTIAADVDIMTQLARIMFHGFLKKEIDIIPKEGK